MAGETKISSLVTVAAYVDANIAPVLRDNNVMMGIVYTTPFENGSEAKKLKHKAGQTAAVVAEAVAATVAEYVQTAGNTLTQKKVVVLNEPSQEAFKFGAFQLEELVQEQGMAISDKIDIDTLALFAGFSNSVGTTTVDLTINQLSEAAYKVRLAKAPGPIVYVLHPTQVFDIQAHIISSAAPVWSNPSMIELLNSQPKPNHFRGSIFGIDVYDSNNCATANAGADVVGACLNAALALAMGTAGGTDTIIDPMTATKRTQNVSSAFYFDVKERLDGAGCKIVTDA